MRAQLYHLQVNVRDAARSLPFYKALLGYLEYRTVYETDSMAGFSGPRGPAPNALALHTPGLKTTGSNMCLITPSRRTR